MERLPHSFCWSDHPLLPAPRGDGQADAAAARVRAVPRRAPGLQGGDEAPARAARQGQGLEEVYELRREGA